MHRAKVYTRVRGLQDLGLVRLEPGIRGPGVYLATRTGLSVVGCELSAGTVSAASYAHDLATVDAGIGFELEVCRDGGQVLSTRELHRCGHTYAIQVRQGSRGAGGVVARHWPDLVQITPAGQRVAVEVELTQKASRRLGDKLAAYASSDYFRVVYMVPTDKLKQRLEHHAAKTGLGQRLAVIVTGGGEQATGAAQSTGQWAVRADQARVAELREQVRQLPYLLNRVPILEKQLARSQQQAVEREQQLLDQIRALHQERHAFVQNGMLERRRTLQRWETQHAHWRERGERHERPQLPHHYAQGY